MSGDGKNRAVRLGISCIVLLLLGPYFGLHHLNSRAAQLEIQQPPMESHRQVSAIEAPALTLPPAFTIKTALPKPVPARGVIKPSKGQLALIEIENFLK